MSSATAEGGRSYRYLELADRIWPALIRASGVHTWLYRTTRGRVGHDIPGVGGRMLLLDHVGARSGKHRTSPLLYFGDGDDIVIVASKGGYPKHPAWLHNLKANPETSVQIGAERRPVRARVAGAEERERLWPVAERKWAGYRDYRDHSDREIQLVILEPR